MVVSIVVRITGTEKMGNNHFVKKVKQLRKKLIILLALLPISMLSQQLPCCETEKKIEHFLIGVWEEKNTDTKTLYRYEFEKGKGHLTELERIENTDEYLITDDHVFIRIVKYGQEFILEYTDLYSSWTAKLTSLSATKMILKTNGNTIEYRKVSD